VADQQGIFFSIIIPTYNSEVTLKACLQSIADQTYKNLEIIIIDNNSIDQTAEIVKAAQEIQPIKWASEPDKGIYDAINKGIALATGKYIYFLGSDDSLYDENVLQTVHDSILYADADIIYGNVIMRGSNEWVVDRTVHAGEFDLKRLISHNICHQSIFYHNAVFKKIGNYNLKYPVFADHDLNLRCAAQYKFTFIDRIIANFNVGGASTQFADPAFERDRYSNILKYFFSKLHTRPFVDLRLYVQQAAFSKNTNLSFLTRAYCLLVYSKLKLQSLFN
jgi:glycosyltransferase involved in cell wall biosynthesis